MKMAMIIPRKETQTIAQGLLKAFKSTRIGQMPFQSREERLNKRVIRGGSGSGETSQKMEEFQSLSQKLRFHRTPSITHHPRPLLFGEIHKVLGINGFLKHLLCCRDSNRPIQSPGHYTLRELIQDHIKIIKETPGIGGQGINIPAPEPFGSDGQIMINSGLRFSIPSPPPRLRKLSLPENTIATEGTCMNQVQITPISTENRNRGICQSLPGSQFQEDLSFLRKQPMRSDSRPRKPVLQASLLPPSTPATQSVPLQFQKINQLLLSHSYLLCLIKQFQQLLLLLSFKANPLQRPLEPPRQTFFKAWFSIAKEAIAFSNSSFSLKRASWTSNGIGGFPLRPGRTLRREAKASFSPLGVDPSVSEMAARIRAKSVWYSPSRRRTSPTRPRERQVSRKISKFFSGVRILRFLGTNRFEDFVFSISSRVRTDGELLSSTLFFGTWDAPL